jgi:hypothetical protein
MACEKNAPSRARSQKSVHNGMAAPVFYRFNEKPIHPPSENKMRHHSLFHRAALIGISLLGSSLMQAGVAAETDGPAQVMERYFKAVQSHAVEPILDVFAPDAVLVTADREIVGHDKIREFYLGGVLKCKNFTPKPGPLLINGESLAVEIVLQCDGADRHVGDFFTMKNGKITRMVVYSGKGYKPN